MDIQNGIAVHAVRGRRNEYRPLKSVICGSADPLAVAWAFKACGFEDLYVADLDAITGKGDNFAVLEEIAEKTALKLMVDAGVSGLDRAQKLFQSKVSKAIVGTETLPSLYFLKQMLQCFGSEKVVVSLDMKNGRVLSASKSVASLKVLTLAEELQSLDVCELIVLDLARVGSGEGVDLALLKQMLNELKIKVDVGGGVRDINDLQTLERMSVYSVLLATALHSGKVSVEELRRSGFL